MRLLLVAHEQRHPSSLAQDHRRRYGNDGGDAATDRGASYEHCLGET